VLPTSARMPARIGSGSAGQASMIAAKSGSGASAPDSAPTGTGFLEISGEFAQGSIPAGGTDSLSLRTRLPAG
jgi:hypothetical protein